MALYLFTTSPTPRGGLLRKNPRNKQTIQFHCLAAGNSLGALSDTNYKVSFLCTISMHWMDGYCCEWVDYCNVYRKGWLIVYEGDLRAHWIGGKWNRRGTIYRCPVSPISTRTSCALCGLTLRLLTDGRTTVGDWHGKEIYGNSFYWIPQLDWMTEEEEGQGGKVVDNILALSLPICDQLNRLCLGPQQQPQIIFYGADKKTLKAHTQRVDMWGTVRNNNKELH